MPSTSPLSDILFCATDMLFGIVTAFHGHRKMFWGGGWVGGGGGGGGRLKLKM